MVPGTPVGSSIVTQRVGFPGEFTSDVALNLIWNYWYLKPDLESRAATPRLIVSVLMSAWF